jgi:hypothetical protein
MKLSKPIQAYLCFIFFTALTTSAYTQCSPTEVSVGITIHTDDYAYEGYWEVIAENGICGQATLAFGGNTNVGCEGGGDQSTAQGFGYGNNLEIEAPSFCLTKNRNFHLVYVDDWGDAGFEFDISINGYKTTNFSPATGDFFKFNFTTEEAPILDAELYKITSPYVNDDEGNKTIKGIIFNNGQSTITSLNINYQFDGGSVQTQTLSNLSLANYEVYKFTHQTLWTATEGVYTIKTWLSNVNDSIDVDHMNDTIITEVEIGKGTPNIIDDFLALPPVFNTIVTASNQIDGPTDLDFHPILSKKQLWVVNKKDENSGGTTVIVNNAGEGNQADIMRKDGNAWHFMSMPTGIAFSKNGNFATSPGVFDANHNGGEPFTGPALWSSDLAVYAQNAGPGTNGSHLDMLHVSPYSQGIASEGNNVFWVFDGYNKDIVRYDFVDDHGPGNSFHGDAIMHRYSETQVSMDPNNKVVSHLAIHNNWVYVVDNNNQRIFRIDMETGNLGTTPAFGPFESVAEYKHVENYVTENVVNTGLQSPAGIDIVENRMIVSDNTTGEIIIYNIETMPAVELGSISTGAQSIMGVKIGPDGNIWYVDYDNNLVAKITPGTVGITESDLSINLSVAPNPANDFIRLNYIGNKALVQVKLLDIAGKFIYENQFTGVNHAINTVSLDNGLYQLIVTNNNHSVIYKIVIQH